MEDAGTAGKEEPLSVAELSMRAMGWTLRARHMAPTAPDSLGTFTRESRAMKCSRPHCDTHNHVVCLCVLFRLLSFHCQGSICHHCQPSCVLCWQPTSLWPLHPYRYKAAALSLHSPKPKPFFSIVSDIYPVVHTDAAGTDVTLVSIPRFSTTRTAVLINLRTLAAKPMVFAGLT